MCVVVVGWEAGGGGAGEGVMKRGDDEGERRGD